MKCLDGTFVTDSSLCPGPSVKCWDGSLVYSKEECDQFICNFDTYFELPDCEVGTRDFFTCECELQECPDGTLVEYLADCPKPEPLKPVLCWDGTRAEDFFSCPIPNFFNDEYPTYMCENGELVWQEHDCSRVDWFECWNNEWVESED